MKPVFLLRHAACNEPGYLCQSLDRLGVAYEMRCVDRGESPPARLDDVAAIALLGAPVSVYDPLPWIAGELTLIRAAAERELPLLGICFGAQLISAALGGEVCPAPSMQVGWHPVHTLETAQDDPLLAGLPSRFEGFEWHGDTFTPPPGARPLFRGGCIADQGFILGNTLAVQFHPEVTAAQIDDWLSRYDRCLPQPDNCVQTPAEILREVDDRLHRQRTVADRLFAWWLRGLTG